MEKRGLQKLSSAKRKRRIKQCRFGQAFLKRFTKWSQQPVGKHRTGDRKREEREENEESLEGPSSVCALGTCVRERGSSLLGGTEIRSGAPGERVETA